MNVLHLVHQYLPVRMIWLHRLIESHRNVSPSVFAYESRDGLPVVTPCHKALDAPPLAGAINKLSFRLFGRFPMVKEMIERHEIDVLHGHFGNFSYRFLKTALDTNTPLVTSFYGRDLSSLARKKKHRKRYLILFEKGHRFIVEGPSAAKALIKLGCPEDKIRVVHFGIYPKQIPFKRRTWSPGETFEILMAAGLAEKKGHLYALAAVARLVQKGVGVHFTVIGSGEEQATIEKAVTELGLHRHVTLVPGMPYNALIDQMHRAHVFLHPSVTASDGDTEGGAPVVLLDALASGLPVVSSLHADIPTIVPHGLVGLLAPEGDVTALTSHLESLIDHPEQLSAFSESSRKHVEMNHDWNKQILKIEAVYAECVSSKKQSQE